jgi:hypothetical protein
MNNFDLRKFLQESKIQNEIHNASGTEEFNKLVQLLQEGVQQAKKVYLDAENNPDIYEGSEGADVAVLLEQIWNAFSTGNHKDAMYRDEIFK